MTSSKINRSKKIISGLISLVEVARVFLGMEQDTCRLALISGYVALLLTFNTQSVCIKISAIY